MVGTPPPVPDGAARDAAPLGPSMEVLELFPRYVLKGSLPPALLQALRELATEVLKAPERSPDASRKLAGQLALQLVTGGCCCGLLYLQVLQLLHVGQCRCCCAS